MLFVGGKEMVVDSFDRIEGVSFAIIKAEKEGASGYEEFCI